MVAAYRSSDGTLNASSNSVTVTKPASTADGDIMLALIYVNDATATITPPTGWTIIDTINTTITAKETLYWKRADSEGASYIFNFSVTTRNRGSIHSFTGVANSLPYNAHSVQGNDSGTNAIAPTITSVVDNSLIVFLCGQDSALTSTYTPPSGMTERYDSGGASAQEVADVILATAGATGTKTATPTDTTDQNAGFLVALTPQAFDTVIDQTSTSGEKTAVSTFSWNHTVAGTNRVLIVEVASRDATDADLTISGITFNSVALTKIINNGPTSNNVRSEAWYLIAPDTGTHAIAVTFSGIVDVTAGFAVSLVGRHQTTPIEASNEGNGNVQSSWGVAVTAVATTSCIVEMAYSKGTSTEISMAVAADRVEQLHTPVNGANADVIVASVQPLTSSGSKTMTWNDSLGSTWSQVVISVAPVATVTVKSLAALGVG